MGAITWRAAAKVPDYALLAAFVVGAVGAWLALTAMTRRLERRWGMDSAGEFLATLGFCSLPFVAWFGAQIVRAITWRAAAKVPDYGQHCRST